MLSDIRYDMDVFWMDGKNAVQTGKVKGLAQSTIYVEWKDGSNTIKDTFVLNPCKHDTKLYATREEAIDGRIARLRERMEAEIDEESQISLKKEIEFCTSQRLSNPIGLL